MKTEHIAVYYDYTCPYSYRALRWLESIQQAGRELTVTWETFSIKEVNRGAREPSYLSGTPHESVSILALELAKATQAGGPEMFAAYHAVVFDAMHGQGRKLTQADVLNVARDVGLDVAGFEAERMHGQWLAAVAGDHREGIERWSVFGTPTLVFQDETAAYLKFTSVPPSPQEAAEVLDALMCLARCHPELVEIKYPQAA